jgi:hypothetical protein
MFFRARRYIVAEGKADAFTAFFLQRLLPVEERYGGRLVGRWQTEDESEVLALWAYQSQEAASQCAKAVSEDPAWREATSFRERYLDPLYLEEAESDLYSTVPLRSTLLAPFAGEARPTAS